ncbi:dethiobiotin synthase [Chryseobacterium potabilaquae]|uniref:ATP-dependent dethiobiotin synthetase BioD n=1 Tax=Chryseobacterium potabilaquae TaxID=2675057 RepID=A0A6N4X8S0_9FLAO|nr:dethiobiotin synthase [Chryseobacterium potabilaquae]CAA7196078.1 ATP-dependent dethiobiotin synthetase BioD 1 [Chryseobacterium potabilaquae]
MNLFITGIGTEIGKTVCSAILTTYFKADYWKPIQSGDLHYTDSMKIKDWVGEQTICHPETYRLVLAASPHQSASEENISIKIDDFQLPKSSNHIIVEGAGGLMVPLSDNEFMIDLIVKLNIPVVMVIRNYLGCINHSLLSILALKQKKIKLEYVIFNGDFPEDTERVIRKNINKETKIINIPEIESLTRKDIECITKKIKIKDHEYKNRAKKQLE